MKKSHTLIVKCTLAVFGIVAGIGCLGVAFGLHTKSAAHRSTIPRIYLMMGQIEMAIDIYAMRNGGKLPDSLDELIPFASGLTDMGKPLLKEEDLIDPWGEPFEYERYRGKFILRSSGPDKIMGTADDKYSGRSRMPPTNQQPKQTPSIDGQETNAVQTATPEPAPPPAATPDVPRPAVVEAKTPERAATPLAQLPDEPAKPGSVPWKTVSFIGIVIIGAAAAWRHFRKK